MNAGTGTALGQTTIEATVPYAEVTDYATRLRSLSRGTGEYEVELSGYEQVPDIQPSWPPSMQSAARRRAIRAGYRLLSANRLRQRPAPTLSPRQSKTAGICTEPVSIHERLDGASDKRVLHS